MRMNKHLYNILLATFLLFGLASVTHASTGLGPDADPVADAVAAAKADPTNAATIAATAAAANPADAVAIATAVAKAFPGQRAKIAAAVAKSVPAQEEEIVYAVATSETSEEEALAIWEFVFPGTTFPFGGLGIGSGSGPEIITSHQGGDVS